MKISIRTNILVVFLLSTFSIVAILLFSQYYFSKKIALEATQKDFEHLSHSISKNLETHENEMKKLLEIMAQEHNFSQKISLHVNHDEVEKLVNIIRFKPQIKSIFYTDNKNSFVEVIHLEGDNYFKKFSMPSQTQWVVVTLVSNQEKYSYFDEYLHKVGSYQQERKYFYQQLNWYKKATQHRGLFISKPYMFSYSQRKGITYAKYLGNGRVIGIDTMLKSIGKLLDISHSLYKIEVFLLPHKEYKTDTISLTQANSKRFYQVVKKLKNGEYMMIRTDADELLKPYKKNLIYSLTAALILTLLFIPIIFMSTGFLVRPIKKLILENKKIAQREFDKVEQIDTNIIEFHALSYSMVKMAKSIQEYQTAQERLLDSIIQLIAEAIDTKSPYTGGHCRRVPEIAMMLLEEADKAQEGELKSFTCKSKEEKKEFEIAAWLHDCGKVTTPEYVVDKATKLETIYNRIHEIRMRFEVLLRDAKIEYLEGNIDKKTFQKKEQQLQDDFAFIAAMNLGGEFMDEKKKQRLHDIAKQKWLRHFDDRAGLSSMELQRYPSQIDPLPVEENLLADKPHHKIQRVHFDYEGYKKEGFKEEVPELLYDLGEIYNLSIERGTLTKEERFKINEHVIMTIKMLEKIPFPEYYKKIPQYAGGHHETPRGDGYPKKLTKEQLSIPARILAIADIFEALSASDRPYKKGKKLSECIAIMSSMAENEQIDSDIFKLFITSGVYKTYAQRHFAKEMIDEVDLSWV